MLILHHRPVLSSVYRSLSIIHHHARSELHYPVLISLHLSVNQTRYYNHSYYNDYAGNYRDDYEKDDSWISSIPTTTIIPSIIIILIIIIIVGVTVR
jgi:hypothetical protein